MIDISPSLLPVPSNLIINYANKTIELGAKRLHLDIIDGKFVNKYGLEDEIVDQILETCHQETHLDVHLMVTSPLDYIRKSSYIFASKIYVHLQKDIDHLVELKNAIESKGCEAGLVINPYDDIDINTLNIFSSLLIMGVVPGMSGQSMLPHTFDRINTIKSYYTDHKPHITLDGGVTKKHLLSMNGLIDCCVMGAAIYSQENWENVLSELLISVK